MASHKREPTLLHYSNDNLIEEFEDYLYKTRDKKIVMVSDLDEVYTFDYTHRWKPSYQKMVKAKFINLIDHYKAQGSLDCIFGTLTVNPSKKSILQSMQEIKEAWHNFHNALKNRHKKRTGKSTFQYVLCGEPHKSGYIHLHYIIFECKPSDFVDDYTITKRFSYKTQQNEPVGISPCLDDLWESYGFGYINQFEHVRFDEQRINQLTSYLIKYITKSHSNLLYSAHLWFTNTRSYSTSRMISSVMKLEKLNKDDNDDRIWSFLTTLDGWLLKAEGLHVALSATTIIPEKVLFTWSWINCPTDYLGNPDINP